MKAILFFVVLACFFNFFVRKRKYFGNPTFDFFIITTFEIIFKLTLFLFIVAKDFLACCLDYSCEVQVFFEIYRIVNFFIPFDPILQRKLYPVELQLLKRTTIDGFAGDQVIDEIGFIANRAIIGLERLVA